MFFKDDGEGKVFNRKVLIPIGSIALIAYATSYMYSLANQDTSHVSRTSKTVQKEGKITHKTDDENTKKTDYGNLSINKDLASNNKDINRRHTVYQGLNPNLANLKATQVVERGHSSDTGNVIPTGTNFIGKMISTVDSRDENSLIKVLLPYGGSYKGAGRIPKNSIALGAIRNLGKGEKFYISFNTIIYPDGTERKFEAHALDSKDYSAGLTGDHHGNTSVRVATSLGLTAISAASGILVKQVPVGNLGAVTPASTMENAMYGAVSKVTESEARRQASELTNVKDYITYDSGRELIISLTKPFKGQ